ncbi:MAG: peptidylprolyl isomerase [Gammaproteobacteria bacterium]|jgi:FKBP-type peptidyl-prolyl cis-trans isomerase SlpA|nr:peptidylprolyl isomerase [Gammaproteobacteria bacterium]
MSDTIGENSRVTLHFAVLLDTGEEVDTTRRGQPATFEVGDGNLLPGFEQALMGMCAGDDAQLELTPEQAFGEHRRENVQLLDRAGFPAEDLEPGTMISFAGPGGELPGVVRRVFERTVEVDFNHPLAGRHIVFDVSILKVEDLGRRIPLAHDPSSEN